MEQLQNKMFALIICLSLVALWVILKAVFRNLKHKFFIKDIHNNYKRAIFKYYDIDELNDNDRR